MYLRTRLPLIVFISLILIFLISNSIIYTIVKDNLESKSDQELTGTTEMINSMAELSYDLNYERNLASLRTAQVLLEKDIHLDSKKQIRTIATNQITKEKKEIKISSLYGNGKPYFHDNDLIDRISSITGGTVTIFQLIPGGLLRISTSVKYNDGTRATGTYIPEDSPVYKSIVSGEVFKGRAFVVDNWYITAYAPLKDSNDNIIGALYTGLNQANVDELRKKMNRVAIWDSGFAWICDLDGNAIIHPSKANNLANLDYFVKMRKLKSGTIKHVYSKDSEQNKMLTKFMIMDKMQWLIAVSVPQKEVYATINILTIIFGIVFLLIFIFAIFITAYIRKILLPLNSISNKMQEISDGEGDLTVTIDVNTKDEIGELATGFNRFVKKLHDLIFNVREIADILSASSHELSSGSLHLSDYAQDQASSAEEVSASIENISADIEDVADKAMGQDSALKELKHHMTELSDIITDMQPVIDITMGKTLEIKTNADKGQIALNDVNNSMTKIAKSSEEMQSIISIINDISDQINLLSLNAAIESARAGDMGKGFAVVADEISKLADETAKSIGNINLLIQENSSETLNGNENVKGLVEKIGAIITGVDLITEQMNSITEFMNRQKTANQIVNIEANTVEALSRKILDSTTEQKTVTSEIVTSITSITEMTQTNAASAEEISVASNNVSDTADKLKGLVNKFNL